MDFTQYSALAIRTASGPATRTENDQITNAALGLAGESGEFADHIKKFLYQGHDLDRAKLLKELGDILWYVNLGATALGVPLEEIATQNIQKLSERYPGGQFAAARSINRPE